MARARIFEDKIINRDWYFKSMHRIDQDKFDVRDISKMLQLLSLEIWYRLFVTCEIIQSFVSRSRQEVIYSKLQFSLTQVKRKVF